MSTMVPFDPTINISWSAIKNPIENNSKIPFTFASLLETKQIKWRSKDQENKKKIQLKKKDDNSIEECSISSYSFYFLRCSTEYISRKAQKCLLAIREKWIIFWTKCFAGDEW